MVGEMKSEIDRRIQVEELHAHRKIMEPLSNAERLEHYESKKALWRCFPQPKRYGDLIPIASSADVLAFRRK